MANFFEKASEWVQRLWRKVSHGPKEVVRSAGDFISDHPYVLAAWPLTPFMAAQVGLIGSASAVAGGVDVIGTVPVMGATTDGLAGGVSMALGGAPLVMPGGAMTGGFGSVARGITGAVERTRAAATGSTGIVGGFLDVVGGVADAGAKLLSSGGRALGVATGASSGLLSHADLAAAQWAALAAKQREDLARLGATLRNEDPRATQIPWKWIGLGLVGIVVAKEVL